MFALRVPFTLPSNQSIGIDRRLARVGTLSMMLDRHDAVYVLVVANFPDEAATNNFAAQAKAGLIWVMLNLGISPTLQTESFGVNFVGLRSPTPEALSDAIRTDMGWPVTSLAEDEIRAASQLDTNGSDAIRRKETPRKDVQEELVLRAFAEGIAFPGARRTLSDSKFCLATELFASYLKAPSPAAGFIALTMSLEALAGTLTRTQPGSKWMVEMKQTESQNALASLDAEPLEKPYKQPLGSEETGVCAKIQDLIRRTLIVHGDRAAQAAAANVAKIWDVRDLLLRCGYADSGVLLQATADARSVVERALKERFSSIARIS